VFFRIGGAGVGKATQSLVVNSNRGDRDDMWLWRADMAPASVGPPTWRPRDGGQRFRDVTMYGLFVEHYQQFQVI